MIYHDRKQNNHKQFYTNLTKYSACHEKWPWKISEKMSENRCFTSFTMRGRSIRPWLSILGEHSSKNNKKQTAFKSEFQVCSNLFISPLAWPGRRWRCDMSYEKKYWQFQRKMFIPIWGNDPIWQAYFLCRLYCNYFEQLFDWISMISWEKWRDFYNWSK